ncbi:endonuclease-8 [Jatrophihabitans endophyticus]|uniref:DNA-(apurinic or apyrimidinic site) lyase n=1 Tax=Jatrophihabitans endophyticus TaxID=1206085 RepID=A0A1M5UNT2_9ACTN|nr:DNA-formamidopyrimidine glycosylase family protein [Jatrophihabitans endophyticus]SHH64570.1 endonuclease-8 [Jatrophihabitans endophyticus]
MPEGHTLHRLARDQERLFGGTVVAASSPQGRFAEGAAQLDGQLLTGTEAYGKHLLHHYGNGRILHVHLGLYGKFATGRGEPPEPRGALRLRLVNDAAWTDLRGPTACELLTPDAVETLLARLGPDPLRARQDPAAAYRRVARSRTPIGALLMDQSVLAGVGNVYRAEVLFRARLHPLRPGRDVPERLWLGMWDDLVTLMRAGVRAGRIVTTRPEDRPAGRVTRDRAHYVYRRTGLPCRVCSTPIAAAVLVARNLFWCPTCQAPTP